MVASISKVQSTVTSFPWKKFWWNSSLRNFLQPPARSKAYKWLGALYSSLSEAKQLYFNKNPLYWSSRVVNSRTLWLYRVQARPFKFTALVFNRIKMATERDEAIVSERRDDWGMSDRDRKWVSSAESSLVIDPCHQTAGCYMQVCIHNVNGASDDYHSSPGARCSSLRNLLIVTDTSAKVISGSHAALTGGWLKILQLTCVLFIFSYM